MKLKKPWRPLDIASPPKESGIYAVTSGSQWLYIGRSINIAARVTNPCHPIQITKNLTSLQMSYFWQPAAKDTSLARQENALIHQYDPEWNGSTEFGGPSKWPTCAAMLPISQEAMDALMSGWTSVMATLIR